MEKLPFIQPGPSQLHTLPTPRGQQSRGVLKTQRGTNTPQMSVGSGLDLKQSNSGSKWVQRTASLSRAHLSHAGDTEPALPWH